MNKITSKEQLDQLLKDNTEVDCFVALAGGLARSSKNISLDAFGDYIMYNEIDDSEDTITQQDFNKSILNDYITNGVLYQY